jgi:hypothetical protein
MSSVGNQGRSGAQSVQTADRVGDLNNLDASLCNALSSSPTQEGEDRENTAPPALKGCSTLGAETEGISAFYPAPHPMPDIFLTNADIGSSLSATEELIPPVVQLGQTSDASLRQQASITGPAQQLGTAAAVAELNETGDQGLLQTHSQPPQSSLSPEAEEPSCHYYLPKGLLSLSFECQGAEAAVLYEAHKRKLCAEAAAKTTQERSATGSIRVKKIRAADEEPWRAAAMRNARHRELSSSIDGVFQMDDLLNGDAAHEFPDPYELSAGTDDEDSEDSNYDEDYDDDDECQVEEGTPRPPLSRTIKEMIVFYEEKWRARLARAKLRCVTPEQIVRGFCCR